MMGWLKSFFCSSFQRKLETILILPRVLMETSANNGYVKMGPSLRWDDGFFDQRLRLEESLEN